MGVPSLVVKVKGLDFGFSFEADFDLDSISRNEKH